MLPFLTCFQAREFRAPELAIISAVLLGIAFSKKLLFREQKNKVCNTDRSTVGIAHHYIMASQARKLDTATARELEDGDFELSATYLNTVLLPPAEAKRRKISYELESQPGERPMV